MCVYVPWIYPYIHFCNNTVYFLYSIHSSVILHTFFNTFYWSSLYPLKLFKTSEQRNTVCSSNNRDGHDNRNGPIQISIAYHFPDSFKFLQAISLKPSITPRERDAEQLLFTIRVNGSLGYRYHNTSHYSSWCCNYNEKMVRKKFLKCLWVSKVVGTGLLRPATVPQVMVEVVKVVEIGLKIPSNLPQVIAEVVDVGQVWSDTLTLIIVEDMLIEVYLGNNIPANLTLSIKGK